MDVNRLKLCLIVTNSGSPLVTELADKTSDLFKNYSGTTTALLGAPIYGAQGQVTFVLHPHGGRDATTEIAWDAFQRDLYIFATDYDADVYLFDTEEDPEDG